MDSRRFTLIMAIGFVIGVPSTWALAHGNQPVTPVTLWSDWSFEPLTILILLASLILYDSGIKTLWAQAGRGHGIRAWQPIAFKGGLIVVAIALISPLDALSAVLFSAHMVQHLLLLFVAAPLFVISAAPIAFLWALPIGWRRRLAHGWRRKATVRHVWSTLTQPLTAWTLYLIALWLWHLPGFYQAALGNSAIHALEHVSFLASSGLFWWVLIKPSHRAADYGIGALYIATTALHSSILGALLVFSSQPWYPAYGSTAVLWGIAPLADQQMAGLIMWLPIGVVYLGTAAVLILLWLRAVEQAMQRREQPFTLTPIRTDSMPEQNS